MSRIKMSELKKEESLEHICRSLAMELAGKYPAGSSIPGREIDLAIINYSGQVDMRDAWDTISGILQNIGRKIV